MFTTHMPCPDIPSRGALGTPDLQGQIESFSISLDVAPEPYSLQVGTFQLSPSPGGIMGAWPQGS